MEASLSELETTTQDDAEICWAAHPDFLSPTVTAVLRTFFRMPRINWKKNDKPRGRVLLKRSDFHFIFTPYMVATCCALQKYFVKWEKSRSILDG